MNATLLAGSGNTDIVNLQCSVMSGDVLLGEAQNMRASVSSGSSTLSVKLTHFSDSTGASLTPLTRYTVYTPTCWAQVVETKPDPTLITLTLPYF